MKFVLAAALILLTVPAFAQTVNSVYMDQYGSNSTITITQTGSNNAAGTELKSNVFHGNSQVISMLQIGSGNVADVTMNGDGASLTSNVNGNLNSVTVNCGTGASGPGASCTDSVLTATITGGNNTINNTNGSKATSSITLNGDHNSATINNTSNNLLGAVSSINAVGGYNTLSITQDGPAGLNGFVASIDVAGSSNTISVTQSGTVDSNVQIKSIGSSNTITVRSGN
jgi:Curlin associated repeat